VLVPAGLASCSRIAFVDVNDRAIARLDCGDVTDGIDVTPITSGGNLAPSGTIPPAPTAQTVPQLYGVVLVREESFEEAGLKPMDSVSVPGGAAGTGAIYTNRIKAAHVIGRVMLRMQAWPNYLNRY